jgi:ketosteroid isomerase-like protein
MHTFRRRTAAAVIIAAAMLGCGGTDGEDAAANPDSANAAVAQAPAELTARGDAFEAAWNQEDPAAVAAFFTEDAVVTTDTATFTGREAIQRDWIVDLPAITNLSVVDDPPVAQGPDYRGAGRYTMTLTTPEGPVQVTGSYDAVWTVGLDSQWYIRSMTVRADPPPAASTGV